MKWSNIEAMPSKNSHLQLIWGNVIHCPAFRLAHIDKKLSMCLNAFFSVRMEASVIVKGAALSAQKVAISYVILIYFEHFF